MEKATRKGRNKTETKGIWHVIAAKLNANAKLETFVYVGLVVLILLLYLSSLFPEKTAVPGGEKIDSILYAYSEQEVEQRLSEALSDIRGAGSVRVMVTYDSGPELVPAMTSDTNTNRSETSSDGTQSSIHQQTESQKPVTVSGSGGTTPIILTEKQPAIRGVIVVADGAGDISVRLDLQRAVQTVLHVAVENIEIFEREKNVTE